MRALCGIGHGRHEFSVTDQDRRRGRSALIRCNSPVRVGDRGEAREKVPDFRSLSVTVDGMEAQAGEIGGLPILGLLCLVGLLAHGGNKVAWCYLACPIDR